MIATDPVTLEHEYDYRPYRWSNFRQDLGHQSYCIYSHAQLLPLSLQLEEADDNLWLPRWLAGDLGTLCHD